MTEGIFVDSSAWYALADRSDASHSSASNFFSGALRDYREVVSSNHVIGETYTLIRYRLGYAAAQGFLRGVWESRWLRVVFISQELEREAYTLLERYSDQIFGFVDATCFVVMKHEGIPDCFGFDSHFAAAGFTVLPALR